MENRREQVFSTLLIGVIGSTVLGLGIWVYIVERAIPPAVFALVELSDRLDPVFGFLSMSLPSFSHAFSFSVFTVMALGITRYALACGSWILINCVAEMMQHDVLAYTMFGGSPENWAEAYFVNGTFDVLDLLAVLAGGISAYILLHLLTRLGLIHRSET